MAKKTKKTIKKRKPASASAKLRRGKKKVAKKKKLAFAKATARRGKKVVKKSKTKKGNPPSPRLRRTRKKKLVKKVKSGKAKRRKPAFAKAMAGKVKIKDNVRESKIMIIGIGGGGCSIINEIAPKLKKVSFVAANTDTQALQKSVRGVKRFQFGRDLTQGLGCGMNSNLGRICAKNEKERIIKLLKGVDLCILISCLGGGTGSGATPVFAEILKELKKTSLGIFTLPFKFEGEKKSQISRNSLEKMNLNLNAQIALFNEKIFKIIDRKTPLKEAFSSINKKLIESLEGLIEMIYLPGLINIDFADLKMILQDDGKIAYLSSVKADGPNRVEQAAKKALKSPLNEYNIETTDSSEASVPLNGSSFGLVPERILFNITASQDLKMLEVEQISKIISFYNKQARIVFGVSYSAKYGDKLRITLLATGKREVSPVKKLKKLLSPPAKSIPREKFKEKIEAKAGSVLVELRRGKEKSEEKPKELTEKKPKEIKSTKLPVKSLTKTSIKLPVELPEKSITQISANQRLRKNALDIKKDIEHIEEKMLEEEKKWDIPAFLRKKEQYESHE